MKFRALLAELIGTFTVTFTVVSAIAADAVSRGSLGATGIALAYGLATAVMVSAVGYISGGHLNPAVTFGLWVGGKIGLVTGVTYWAAQVLGAIAAALCVRLIYPAYLLASIHLGTPHFAAPVTPGQALAAELIATFFLVFVFFGTTVDGRAARVGGLFVGLTVTLDVLAVGAVSGGALNPARFTGPAIFGNYVEQIWLFWLGPLAGSALAGAAWRWGGLRRA